MSTARPRARSEKGDVKDWKMIVESAMGSDAIRRGWPWIRHELWGGGRDCRQKNLREMLKPMNQSVALLAPRAVWAMVVPIELEKLS